jgi:hypothetical protein
MGDLSKIATAEAIFVTDGSSQQVGITTATPSSTAAALVVREAAQGQKTMASSIPIVIASDQSTITVAGSGTFTVQDTADGPVTAGAAATKSMLIGGVYNTAAPAPTNGQQVALQLDSSGNLKINLAAGGGSGGTSMTDDAAFTAGSTAITPAGGVFNDSITTPSSGQGAACRITQNRGLHVNLRNASGTEIATTSNPAVVQGAAASGASISGNPVLEGGRAAVTASPTAVSDGQAVAMMMDRSGRVCMTNGAGRDLVTAANASTTTTTTTTIFTAGGAGVFLDITKIIIANFATSSNTTVTILDNGTAVIVVNMPGGALPAIMDFNPPLPQAAANTAWAFQVGSVVANGVRCHMVAIKNK